MDPLETMERYIAAMRAHDWEAGMAFYDEDVVFRIPGRSRFAGEHRGRAAAMEYIRAAVALSTEREVEVELVDTLVGTGRVALMVRERFSHEGGTLEISRVNVYRVRDGRIVEVAIFEGDQYEVDELLADA